MPTMDQDALAEIKRLEATNATADQRYMDLLMRHHYVQHILRMPADEWPDPVNRAFAAINQAVYASIQGPSELGAGGVLLTWDRTEDLPSITVPTLVIGAEHDTMDPAFMRMMAERLARGTYLHCPNGRHMAMYDDQATYFEGLTGFTRYGGARGPTALEFAPPSGSSSAGRVSASQAECRGFESRLPLQLPPSDRAKTPWLGRPLSFQAARGPAAMLASR
jgi:hypothetical protein